MSNILSLIFPSMELTLSQDMQPVAQDPIPWATRQINQKIPAGYPGHPYDETASEVDLNDWLIDQKAATFVFSVCGESMSGIGILDGDKVIVDRSKTPRHGSVVIAVLNQQYTIKRLYMKDGKIGLMPENPKFKPDLLQEFVATSRVSLQLCDRIGFFVATSKVSRQLSFQ